MRNEFNDRVYGKGERNPVDYLSFDMGIGKCLLFMIILYFVVRFISLIFLRVLIKRF